MATYTVHGLDVWGNEEEGFDVNDVYPSQGKVDISDDAWGEAIVAQLIDAGYVRDDIDRNKAEVSDNDGFDIDISYDGKPELLLRKVQS